MEKEFIIDDSILLSSSKRFLNFLLDKVLMIGCLFIFGFILGIFIELFALQNLNNSIQQITDLQGQMFFIFFGLFYYLIQESIFGTTLGKIISGAIVVDENGNKPRFNSVLKRTLCRIIPFDGLSYLGDNRGWHDSISDTYVVNKKELFADKKQFEEINTIGNLDSN